jgi:hypothetical protein
MPKQIATPRRGIGYAGPHQRKPHDVRDGARGSERSVRRRRSQEYSVVVDERPGLFQVIEQSVTSVLRQRQLNFLPSFASDSECSLVPTDVIETHAKDVASPQTETGEEKQNGLVANAVTL